MTCVLELLTLEKYKDHVRVDTSHCLQYTRRQSVLDKEIIFTVHLPFDCLREWCGARQKSFGTADPMHFRGFLFDRTAFRVKSNWQRI